LFYFRTSHKEGCLVDKALGVFTRGLALVPVLALAFATSGCGSSADTAAGTASCTISEMVAGLSDQICEEASGLSATQAQQLMQQCMLPGGGTGADAGISQQAMYAAGPCSRINALGGCREVQGGITVVAWYYQAPGFTAADIQMLCAEAGATYVAP
jgi:hypothetical protein